MTIQRRIQKMGKKSLEDGRNWLSGGSETETVVKEVTDELKTNKKNTMRNYKIRVAKMMNSFWRHSE